MPDNAQAFNLLGLEFLNAQKLPGQIKSERGRDTRKEKPEWKDVKRVHEFDDGWYVGYVNDPDDTALLGTIQGHCSGTHWVWTVEERIWYFFVLFDPGDHPRSTIHMKQASWVGKKHPRDDSEVLPVEVGGRFGYPSLAQAKECFLKAGQVYEAGKYRPAHYLSQTYDYLLQDGGAREQGTFAYTYGNPLRCLNKPANVDDEVWQGYVKAGKALEANFNKNSGAVRVVGRRVKFDGKWLIVLSATDKSQADVAGAPGKRIAEWLAQMNKEKK